MNVESRNNQIENIDDKKYEALDAVVADLVKKQIDRELQLIKESGGIALKILGASLALFLAVFTLFGITTWNDIKKETKQYVKSKTDSLLNSSNTETGVKSNLNTLLNMSIVNSYLIKLSKSSVTKLNLRDNEWSRIKSWIKGERLGLQEFKDALTILNAQEEEKKRKDVFEFLSEMINPVKDSQYTWIRKQPDKILAILENFKHKDLGSSTIKAVLSEKYTEDLRIEAVQYVKEIGYTEGYGELIEFASYLKKGKLRVEILITCASLDPLDDRFKEEVKKLLDTKYGNERIRAILAIVIEVYKFSKKNKVAQSTLLLIQQYNIELLHYAIELGAYLQIDEHYYEKNGASNYHENIGIQVLYPSSSGVPGMKFSSIVDLKKWHVYWKSLEILAVKEDIDGFRKLLISDPFIKIIARGKIPIFIEASLGESTNLAVELDSGEKLMLSNGNSSNIKIFPVDVSFWVLKSKSILIAWRNNDGELIFGELKGFSGKSFQFKPGLKLGQSDLKVFKYLKHYLNIPF